MTFQDKVMCGNYQIHTVDIQQQQNDRKKRCALLN